MVEFSDHGKPPSGDEQAVIDLTLDDAVNDLLKEMAESHREEAKNMEKAGKLLEAREEYIKAEAAHFTYKGANWLVQVEEKLAKRARELLYTAEKLYAAGKPEESIAKLEEAIQLVPRNSVLYYNLALSLHKLGRIPEAVEYLGQSMGLTSDLKEKRNLQQIQILFATGEKPKVDNFPLKEEIEKFNELAVDPEAENPCVILERLRSAMPESASLSFNLAK